MLYKYRKVILSLIIGLGFVLRFYNASIVPLNSDEMIDFKEAKQEISFNPHNLKLPLVDKISQGNISYKYLICLGWNIFGNSPLGARLPFVILGTLTILLVYFLAKTGLGVKKALLAAFLISISQFHIGVSRVADYNSPHLFFVALSLFFFYKGLIGSNKKLILLNGIIIGIGFWVKESMIFMIPIYIIFLWLFPHYRHWLKDKYMWISFIIASLIVLPFIVSELILNVPRVSYIRNNAGIGISMNAISLYLDELILLAIKPFPAFFDYVVDGMEPTLPYMNFVLGILVLLAVIKSVKNKDAFIRLLSVCFIFNFVLFSFLRQIDRIKNVWALGSPDWSILGFIAGVILAANMLDDFIKKNKYYGRILFIALILFMFIRTWSIVTYPLNCYFPTRDFCIRGLLWHWSYYVKQGEVSDEAAKDIFERIYTVADSKPLYKKIAAFRLAQLFFKEGKNAKYMEYWHYVISQNSNNHKALDINNPLELLDELKWEPHFD